MNRSARIRGMRKSPASALEEAVAYINDLLNDGPKSVSEVKAAIDRKGIAYRTYQRARKKLCVVRIRSGFGSKGVWWLKLAQSANLNQHKAIVAGPTPAAQHSRRDMPLFLLRQPSSLSPFRLGQRQYQVLQVTPRRRLPELK